MELGERIALIRVHADLNQGEFGKRIGVSQQQVSAYEREDDPVEPSESVKLLMCKEFCVRYEWLTQEEGAQYKEGTPEAGIVAEKPELYLKRKELIERVRQLANETTDEDALDTLINTVKMIPPQKKEE